MPADPRLGSSGFDRRHHRPEPGAKGGDAASVHPNPKEMPCRDSLIIASTRTTPHSTSRTPDTGLARQIPHGYRWLGDHLIRAVCATPVLTAEGANRTSPGTKRQRFSEALGECGEAAAVAELVERLSLVGGDGAALVLARADHTAALLKGLVKKFA